MGELLNALTPYPMALGIAIGLIIAAIGVWAMRKGMQDRRDREPAIEDQRAEWAAYQQLEDIRDCCIDMKDSLRKIADSQKGINETVGRLASVIWNRSQGI